MCDAGRPTAGFTRGRRPDRRRRVLTIGGQAAVTAKERERSMARLKILDPETTKGWTGRLLKKARDCAQHVQGDGQLGGKNVKMIILATSELNGCEYCVSAHTAMATNSDLLTPEESLNARKLKGVDEKSTAVLAFVKQVWDTNGKVSDGALKAVKDAGFGDKEIVEMLGVMSLATLANYVSNVAEPDLDFDEAPEIS